MQLGQLFQIIFLKKFQNNTNKLSLSLQVSSINFSTIPKRNLFTNISENCVHVSCKIKLSYTFQGMFHKFTLIL